MELARRGIKILIVAMLIAVVVLGVLSYQSQRKRREAEQAQAVQEAAKAQREHSQRIFDADTAAKGAALEYGEAAANEQLVQKEAREYADWAAKLKDSFDIVTRTSRISLAQPMMALQSQIREFEKIKYQSCIEEARQHLSIAVDSFYKGMLDFMSKSENPFPESVFSAETDAAKNAAVQCRTQSAERLAIATDKRDKTVQALQQAK
ncbi:MAG: hypothetical protein JSS42_10710 [Proteobacteria bacterium]|nr:hypothetical protein [Pseudomonadota bacterium]